MNEQVFDSQFTSQSPWLDLVNSQQWDGFGVLTDHLFSDEWVECFLRYWGYKAGDLGADRPRAALTKIRSSLRGIADQITDGKKLTAKDKEVLNELLRCLGYFRLDTKQGTPETVFEPQRRNWKWIKSRIAMDFVTTYIERPDRIKICHNSLCRWVFVDWTKSKSRRWCNDRRCGNRHRVRQSRARSQRYA